MLMEQLRLFFFKTQIASVRLLFETWPRGHKNFYVLNSTEQEISTAHKTKNAEK